MEFRCVIKHFFYGIENGCFLLVGPVYRYKMWKILIMIDSGGNSLFYFELYTSKLQKMIHSTHYVEIIGQQPENVSSAY